MKELKSDLSNVKVGDWVLVLYDGWETIKRIGLEGRYTIKVGEKFFDFDGKASQYNKYPTCFPSDQVPTEFLAFYGPPPCEFKDGDIVKVWWDDRFQYHIGVFKAFHPNNGSGRLYEIYGVIWQFWPHCERWEGEDSC